jgi:hypothetical protein
MGKRGFWIGLAGLCVAVACALAIALALVTATTAVAFTPRQNSTAVDASSDPTPDQTNDAAGQMRVFTGVISDRACGARHLATDKSASECTRACVKKGASYALVNGDRVYRLEGDTEEISRLAGERAQIEGLLQGDVVTVSSIALAQ